MLAAFLVLALQDVWICSHRMELLLGANPSSTAAAAVHHHHGLLLPREGGRRVDGVLRLRGGLHGSESSDPGSVEQDLMAEIEARGMGLRSNHSVMT